MSVSQQQIWTLPNSTVSTVRLACLLEVSARKPGNVHPAASFADCTWQTFADSADAVADVMDRATAQPLGETIYQAVAATRQRVGRNTNLGMILLLAPLAAVPHGPRLTPPAIATLLDRTTPADCANVFAAIRLAAPGGLHTVDQQDVAAAPTVSLRQAMQLAAHRDDVAKQYATDFADVFALARQFTATDLPGLERQIIDAHLDRLAVQPDTLIARKCGAAVAAQAQHLARCATAAGGLATHTGRQRVRELDAWLRADGNRRNPGTTADLIAAGLYVALRHGQLPAFEPTEVVAYADRLKTAPWGPAP